MVRGALGILFPTTWGLKIYKWQMISCKSAKKGVGIIVCITQIHVCNMNIKGAIFRRGGSPEIPLQISRPPFHQHLYAVTIHSETNTILYQHSIKKLADLAPTMTAVSSKDGAAMVARNAQNRAGRTPTY